MNHCFSLPARGNGRSLAGFSLALLAAVPALFADGKPAQPVDKDHAAKMARGLALFKEQVRSVLTKRCLRCHGGKSTESEFDLHDRDGLLKGGTSGPVIVPGKARDSRLLRLVRHQKEPHMPQGGAKLPDETIRHLADWIDLGAPYDRPLLEKEVVAAWTRKVVPAAARQFWSFRPLQRVEPPTVKNEARVRTPVDRFILAKLEAAGIAPNNSVDRRQLLRRASLDLVGLPPAPEEVDAFLKDNSRDAFAKVVDRLLASPRYGERWGRHWLDLARFAESHGFEHDYDRPTAYHYRDFVIQALNDDLPFDTFVKWQLAGDELAPDNPLALKATGFLAAGVHSTQITQREVEKHRYDELDDMIATTGTAMLGLTVGCARCHDHKYDPIPQADYYRLVSAFTTTVRSEIELPVEMEAYRKAKAAFNTEHAPLLAALQRYEKEQLPAHLATWEKNGGAKERPAWLVPDVVQTHSQGGATITPLADGSFLISGQNPPMEGLTFTVHSDLTNVTAVRLEALSHPSLVKGGPGRAGNGNFALSHFALTIAPRSGKGEPVKVKFRSARATFEQKGLPVKAAIDDDPVSAWAVDPQFGKDHAAVFETDKPIGFEGGSVLTFRLIFTNNTQHGLGRPRLSLATAATADLTSTPMSEAVVRALAMPADRRSAEQTASLLRWLATRDPGWQALNRKVQDHLAKEPKRKKVKVLISTEGLPAVRLHTQGADFLNETHFLRRGDPDQKQGAAPLGYLQVLMTASDGAKHWSAKPPSGWRTSYRRTALANWMTDAEHGAGHLLARVIVNRLWQHHMGRGLVATPSDFGTRGEKPTHPELLDWLASELIRNGWRLKPIHKLVVMSATYAESSARDERKETKDRDNHLFWRRPVLRLEAEAVRDSLLAVGGMLDTTMYGPGTLDEASRRRSIYFTVKRSKLIPMLQVFDAPESLVSLGERPATTIAPQALLLMNNAHVRSWARGFARRIAPAELTPIETAVASGYRIALTREPTRQELADSVAFIKSQLASSTAEGRKDAREHALADFCQVLMCLNEFVYVD
ncbi:MAG: PSD1 domain-containing protein [Planctomycetes bacterium]|nr:PSD1 domain-containing protein [Planctomycetota bacterium]